MKIIQIGANSGKDHVFDFALSNKQLIELLILVEPIPFLIDTLKAQYRDFEVASVEAIAIADEKTESFTLYYEEESNYEVSSFNKKHILDHGCPEYKIKSVEVPAMTVNELLDKYHIDELDYLFVDAEGLDIHILSSIDYGKYKIKNIFFEIAHTDGANTRGSNFSKITRYLQNLGYTLTTQDSLNMQASL